MERTNIQTEIDLHLVKVLETKLQSLIHEKDLWINMLLDLACSMHDPKHADYIFMTALEEIKQNSPEYNRVQRELKAIRLYLSKARPQKIPDIHTAKQAKCSEILTTYGIKLSRNTCICPFHKETTPSFSVKESANTWKCFGACSTSGDSIDLFMKLYNCSFLQAVQRLTN